MKANPFAAGPADNEPGPLKHRASDPEQFAAMMAHDLESSLLVLSNNAELLREVGPDLTKEQTGHLAEIERTARRMKRLLGSIRTLSESKVAVDLQGT